MRILYLAVILNVYKIKRLVRFSGVTKNIMQLYFEYILIPTGDASINKRHWQIQETHVSIKIVEKMLNNFLVSAYRRIASNLYLV